MAVIEDDIRTKLTRLFWLPWTIADATVIKHTFKLETPGENRVCNCSEL